ncbi:unnamed protein product [Pleuronectes platessa]|uniref:Uncharacterized protein n=1 Tax=Pleuronectes platessa TaxID=8262 RepID=A0A9N7VC43_PLEPL|nr:unnamed protein product [Pleuronectes platessa]
MEEKRELCRRRTSHRRVEPREPSVTPAPARTSVPLLADPGFSVTPRHPDGADRRLTVVRAADGTRRPVIVAVDPGDAPPLGADSSVGWFA